jgi:hypothetical protein
MPEDWLHGVIYQGYKKRDPSICSHDIGITLLNTTLQNIAYFVT